MASAPVIHLRTPTAVLCDLTAHKARIHCLLAQDDANDSDANRPERMRLEKRAEALESEFRAVIYQHTGVSAALIVEALS